MLETKYGTGLFRSNGKIAGKFHVSLGFPRKIRKSPGL